MEFYRKNVASKCLWTPLKAKRMLLSRATREHEGHHRESFTINYKFPEWPSYIFKERTLCYKDFFFWSWKKNILACWRGMNKITKKKCKLHQTLKPPPGDVSDDDYLVTVTPVRRSDSSRSKVLGAGVRNLSQVATARRLWESELLQNSRCSWNVEVSTYQKCS